MVSCEEGADNITYRIEGPAAARKRLRRSGCELATIRPTTRRARRQTLEGDRSTTCGPAGGSAGQVLQAKLESFARAVEHRNLGGRLIGGKPDEREPRFRFGKWALETRLSYRAGALVHRDNRTHGLNGGCGNGLA